MSERKRPDHSRLSKARRPYRIVPPPPGRRRRCGACGGEAVVHGRFGGGWTLWCPRCERYTE